MQFPDRGDAVLIALPALDFQPGGMRSGCGPGGAPEFSLKGFRNAKRGAYGVSRSQHQMFECMNDPAGISRLFTHSERSQTRQLLVLFLLDVSPERWLEVLEYEMTMSFPLSVYCVHCGMDNKLKLGAKCTIVGYSAVLAAPCRPGVTALSQGSRRGGFLRSQNSRSCKYLEIKKLGSGRWREIDPVLRRCF